MRMSRLAASALLSMTLWTALATPVAAGTYDARRAEMLAALEALKLEPRWQDPIRSTLSAYADFRERVLADALPIVQDESTGNRDQAARWREHFQKAGPEASKLLYAALQEGMPPAARELLTSAANLEADFYAKLATMPAGRLRDRITLYRETFDKESRSLAEKWRAVDSQDQSIDSAARSVQGELRELYQRTSTELASASVGVERWVRAALEAATAIPQTPDITIAILELLRLLDALETPTESYASRFRDLYATEERVILVFSDTRKDVSAFLKTMHLSLLSNEMNEMLIGIDQAGRATLTPGQQADAARLHGLLSTILKGHYEDFEDQFEAFVSEFDHLFFNALGDRTIDSLLEVQSWRDWSEGVRGIALEDALRRVEEQSARNFGIDLDRVEDPVRREQVKAWVRKNMEALRERVGKVHGLSVSDRIQLVVYATLPGSLRARLLDRLQRD